jgi:hypothetical protein
MVFGLRIDFYVVVLCDPEIKDIEGSGHTRGAAIHDLFMNLVNSLQCLEAHERRYYREYPSKDQRERAYLEDENLLLDFDTFGELEAQIDAINSLFEKEVTDD